MKNIGMIYENDMPEVNTKEAVLSHPKYKRKWKRENTHRFKPNGITDNIPEWQIKNAFYNTPNIKFNTD